MGKTDDKRSRNLIYRQELLSRRTLAEVRLAEILTSAGYEFKEQKGFIAGEFHCIVDFYLPKPNRLCIEVDGLYHEKASQIIKDSGKDYYLYGRGFRVLRLKNDEVLNNEKLCLEKIKAALNTRRGFPSYHLPRTTIPW